MITATDIYEKIKDDALHLPLEDRSRLASRLLESLDEGGEVSEEWLEEIRRRARALDEGTSHLTPHIQVMEEVKEGLARIQAARRS